MRNPRREVILSYVNSRPVSCLGEFWGGYAALRFAKLLEADCAISFRIMQDDAPSVIIQEDGTRRSVITPKLNKDDILAQSFIICDPEEPPEKFLLPTFKDFSGCKIISAYRMWSDPTRVIFDTNMQAEEDFATILKHPKLISRQALQKIINKYKHQSEHYNGIFLNNIKNRFLKKPKKSNGYKNYLQNKNINEEEKIILSSLMYLGGEEEAIFFLSQ